jgi:TolA-binding protein
MKKKTANDDLNEFKKFINEYPTSRYVTAAIDVIFERTLDLNTSDCFLDHLQNYPQSPHNEELLSILYHMSPEVFF